MRVITKHVVPMCIPSVVIRITLNMSSIILTAAGLGFSRSWRTAAKPGMGRDAFQWSRIHDDLVVACCCTRHCNLDREPRLQLVRRRFARRSRPQKRIRSMTKPLLEVDDLWVSFPGADRNIDVVRGISFSIGREKVGIVGESGSGKSITGRSILKLTPKAAQIRAKSLRFGEIDLLSASERQMRGVRGNRISMILQDPKYSLNPLIRIGDQIMEAYRLHHRVKSAAARQKTIAMLEAVHIRDPERVMRLFPHEISGGMGQRVMIAMMLIP